MSPLEIQVCRGPSDPGLSLPTMCQAGAPHWPIKRQLQHQGSQRPSGVGPIDRSGADPSPSCRPPALSAIAAAQEVPELRGLLEMVDKGTWVWPAEAVRRCHTGARYYWLLLAEGRLTRRHFGSMLRRIATLPVPAGYVDYCAAEHSPRAMSLKV